MIEIPGLSELIASMSEAVDSTLYSMIENEGLVEGQPWLINDIEYSASPDNNGFVVDIALVSKIPGNSNPENYAKEDMYLSNLEIRANTLIADTVGLFENQIGEICKDFISNKVAEALS